jgi:hypothetical protein
MDTVRVLTADISGSAPRPTTPAWVAPAFGAFAIVLVPWIGYLAATLPAAARTYERLPWVGFDIGLMLALAATSVLAWRGSPRVAFAATVTATMLVIDAWFDVTTSVRSLDIAEALAMSAVELTLAAVCVWLAHHAELVLATNVRRLLRRMRSARSVPEAADPLEL